MTLRTATDKDIPFLSCGKYYGFSDCWTEKMTKDGFNDNLLKGIIAEEDARPAGFITYEESLDFWDIEILFVLPEYRKKGVGGKLIERLLSLAKEKGIEKVFLEVKKTNAEAVSLYGKYSFKKISERENYYPDGETALVMVKEL